MESRAMGSRAARVALLVLLGALALGLRCIGLTAVFGADNPGYGGGFFGIIARNYLRYGHVATGLVPVVTAEGPPSPPIFYSHHPPLVPLLVSASFALFGTHEWAARLVPLLGALASLALLVHLAARFYGWRVAILTLAVATTLPLDAHLATHVDVQGSVLLAGVLGTVACLAHRRFGAALVCFTLAAATDWPALYLPVLLALAPWPFEYPRPRRLVAGLCVYAAVLFLGIATWLGGPGAILGLLRDRALSFRSDQGQPFVAAEWVRLVVGTYLWALCTPGVLLVVLAWCVLRVPALVRRPHAERLALFLLLFGVMHLLVGFQGAYQHEFWAHYLRAGVPLVCALAIERVASAIPPGRLRAASTGVMLAALTIPGIVGTLRLDARPLSARMLDADYTPHALAAAIRGCTPPGASAFTSDYYGEPAMFFYAEHPLAIGVFTPALLAERLRMPRYDLPGGGAPPYATAAAVPACFVLPRQHERYFPELVAVLRDRFPARTEGRFEIFSLDRDPPVVRVVPRPPPP
jgi:4-amino-4-deoxy-L-arabinose transferase-like glycosyltransferase